MGHIMTVNGDEELSEGAKNFLLATEYQTGRRGKPKDLALAAAYMVKAAELGHCLAGYHVATMYFNGQGVAQDLELAREWALRLNATGSHEFAKTMLAAIDEKKSGTDHPKETAADKPKRKIDNIKTNFGEFAKSVLQTLFGICLLASIGYCSGGGRVGEGNGLGELPDNYRKP